MNRLLVLMLTAALVGGCDSLPPRQDGPGKAPAIPGVTRPLSDVEALLQYYEAIYGLSAGDLSREREWARQVYARSSTDYNRLQLALHGTLPEANTDEQAQTLMLVEPLLREPRGQNSGLRRFAMLIKAMIIENRKIADQLYQANQKTKEEQRRSEDLQQKLNAIKSIEKSLIQRDQRPKPSAPSR